MKTNITLEDLFMKAMDDASRLMEVETKAVNKYNTIDCIIKYIAFFSTIGFGYYYLINRTTFNFILLIACAIVNLSLFAIMHSIRSTLGDVIISQIHSVTNSYVDIATKAGLCNEDNEKEVLGMFLKILSKGNEIILI